MSSKHKWRVVPTQLSEAQLREGQRAWLADAERKSSTLYRAMLEAAPPPPDQVLSEQQIAQLLFDHARGPQDQTELAKAVQRAVLKQLGAKNV